jgi:predicted Zn-dependent protease
VKAGDWIEYKGRRNSNGTVAAASVKLSPDVVSKGEGKLRAKNDFDPSVVPSSARQSTTSMAFIGINPKRFPPYDDPAMQARVTSIGEKLIPDYQRGLPDSDPAKIKFRFQLIDTKMFRDALTLPSGVILVPHQVVERMQNDSQLATVLADNIACALEKQTYRMQPANRAATGAFWGGALVPFAGPVISVGAMASAHDLLVKTEQQSGRVALRLMHDAGYDIDQAPLAWWLLAPKNPKPLLEIQLPDRAAYLYRILVESWHNPAASAQLEK